MNNQEHILALLQHGDSFFPSGAVSFSWGLEMLKQDDFVTSKDDVENFLINQLAERWTPFDRVVLAHTFDQSETIDEGNQHRPLGRMYDIAHRITRRLQTIGRSIVLYLFQTGRD